MWPPGEVTPGELPTEDASGDEVPAVVATSPAAAVCVIGASASPECCGPRIFWPYTPSGPRTTGRGVSCRPARFHGLDVEPVVVVVWSVWVACCPAVIWSVSVARCPVTVWSVWVACCPLSSGQCRWPVARLVGRVALCAGRRRPLLWFRPPPRVCSAAVASR